MNEVTKSAATVEKAISDVLNTQFKMRTFVSDKSEKAGADTSRVDELTDYAIKIFNGIKII